MAIRLYGLFLDLRVDKSKFHTARGFEGNVARIVCLPAINRASMMIEYDLADTPQGFPIKMIVLRPRFEKLDPSRVIGIAE